jgi:hypothetical protein
MKTVSITSVRDTRILHPKDYFVKFTGEYCQLKTLGYSFQHLYAGNYQQWNKKDLSVWRKGEDVTHDKFGHRFPAILSQLLNADINNLPFKRCNYYRDTYWVRIYIHKETYECTFDPEKYKAARIRMYESYDRIRKQEAMGLAPTSELEIDEWIEVLLTPKCVEPLQELVNRNWIQIEPRKASSGKNNTP